MDSNPFVVGMLNALSFIAATLLLVAALGGIPANVALVALAVSIGVESVVLILMGVA